MLRRLRGLQAESRALGPAFGRLLASDAATLVALMAGHVALPWWIAQQGGAHDLAAYAVAMAVTSLVGMPLLSPLGDRWPKPLLMARALAVMVATACGLALLATLGIYRLPLVIALEAVAMLALSAIAPAASSLAAELVAAPQLVRAVSLQQSAQSLGRLAGPVLAGGLIAASGVGAALWLHAALLVAAVALARRLPGRTPDAAAARSWWREMTAGLKANWAIPIERGWTAVNFATWIFMFPALAMLVPLKVQSLGLTGLWLGLCEGALALGMLAGALAFAPWCIARWGRFATRVFACCAQGLALALAGFTTTPWVLVAAFGLAGLANAGVTLVGITQRMLARPVDYRARMTAGSIATMQIASALGPALAGAALLRWHVATVYVVFALLGAVFSLALGLVPGFRAFMALDAEQVDGWYERHYPQAFDRR